MPRTDEEIKQANEQIERVLKYGDKEALKWLRAAYHTHEDQLAHMRAKMKELRAACLARMTGTLSVKEAQLLNVCRVCRGSYQAKGVFVFNYGEEFAHQKCLETTTVPDEITSIAVEGCPGKKIVKDTFREVGFDTECWPDKTQETIFFLRSPYGGCSDDTPASRRMASATPEAAAEFIAYWENQIRAVKDYVANGCNPNTQEWKAVMAEPPRIRIVESDVAFGPTSKCTIPIADLQGQWKVWDQVTTHLRTFDPPPTPEEWQILECLTNTPAAKNGLSETRQAIARTVKV